MLLIISVSKWIYPRKRVLILKKKQKVLDNGLVEDLVLERQMF